MVFKNSLWRGRLATSAMKHAQTLSRNYVETERASVPHRAAQDPAQDVFAVGIAGVDPVGNRKTQRPDVVGDHAEGDVGGFLRVDRGQIGRWQRGGVFFAAQLLQLVEEQA